MRMQMSQRALIWICVSAISLNNNRRITITRDLRDLTGRGSPTAETVVPNLANARCQSVLSSIRNSDALICKGPRVLCVGDFASCGWDTRRKFPVQGM